MGVATILRYIQTYMKFLVKTSKLLHDFFIEITDEEWKGIDFVIRHLKLHLVVGYLQRLL